MPVDPKLLGMKTVKVAQTISGKQYKPAEEANPDIQGNDSHTGFKYSPYHHKTGIFFQANVKRAIQKVLTLVKSSISPEKLIFTDDLKIIRDAAEASIKEHVRHDIKRKHKLNLDILDILLYYTGHQTELERAFKNPAVKTAVSFCHTWIKRCYDKYAYINEDSRLLVISDYLKLAMKNTFDKPEIFLKVVDIIVFLMKEDIYYRPRWILIFQDLRPVLNEVSKNNFSEFMIIFKGLCNICENMTLTQAEQENIYYEINVGWP